MKKTLILTLFFVFTEIAVFGQSISGFITDASTRLPISYATVSIPDTSYGVVAGASGEYTLKTDNIPSGSIIHASCIGYIDSKIPLAEIQHSNTCNIELTPASYAIENIIVSPTNTKLKKFGNSFQSRNMIVATNDTMRGVEFGVVIDLKKRAWLQKAEVNVRKCSYKDMVFRLNIYEQDDNGKYVTILRTPIYATVKQTDNLISIAINLSQYDIIAEGKILVAFENIEEKHLGSISFPIGFSGASSLIRYNQADEWQNTELNFRFPISVTAVVCN